MNATPGWYGKLPALGDFARRRLPDGFVNDWDAWLQQCLQASHAALEQTWLTHYLSAPVWCFLLLPGVMGDSAWAGILLPSVDRVGRYFPLTVCAQLPHSTSFGTSLTRLEQWLMELTACGLLGLDADSGHLRLETALQGLKPPASPVDSITAVDLANIQILRYETAASTGFLDGIAARLLPQALAHRSVWWYRLPDRNWTGFCCQGLPPPQCFAGMLTGMPTDSPADYPPQDRQASAR